MRHQSVAAFIGGFESASKQIITGNIGRREAFSGPGHTGVLKTTRTLLDRIVITPAGDPAALPDIELLGDLLGVFKTGGLPAKNMEARTQGSLDFYLYIGSVTGGLRAEPPRYRPVQHDRRMLCHPPRQISDLVSARRSVRHDQVRRSRRTHRWQQPRLCHR